MTTQQQARYQQETQLHILRMSDVDFYNTLWLVLGVQADWVGFQDDYGDFIPVDWC